MPESDCEAIAEIIRNNGNYAPPNEEISGGWSSEEQPAAYYRTTAARARRLQADVTTPRVKQYLDKMIVHCDRLAGKAEQPASPAEMASSKGFVVRRRFMKPGLASRPGCFNARKSRIPCELCNGLPRHLAWPTVSPDLF
jgi:hypothetical protein